MGVGSDNFINYSWEDVYVKGFYWPEGNCRAQPREETGVTHRISVDDSFRRTFYYR